MLVPPLAYNWLLSLTFITTTFVALEALAPFILPYYTLEQNTRQEIIITNLRRVIDYY